MSTEKRKEEHIKICLEKDVDMHATGFDDVFLSHQALPDITYDDVDLTTDFFGKKLKAPILIEAMTGGTKIAEKINKNLAWAAEQAGIAMGLGSQRAALEDPSLESTYQVRDVAPNIFLIGNIGFAQLKKYEKEKITRVIDMVDADALAVHLNILQELVQPEGDQQSLHITQDTIEKIRFVTKELSKPVIAKEAGCGISREAAIKLEKTGMSAIDVAGFGGTSWPLVESYRSDTSIGKTFAGWGIPTVVSLVECCKSVKMPVIASGGVRSGIDMIKSLALGALLCGAALPFLRPATESKEKVLEKIEQFIQELKIAMVLVNAKTIDDLRRKPVLITGRTREVLELRGFDVRKYARR